MSHWSDTDRTCPRCGGRVLRTRSGSFVFCFDDRSCGWRDPPATLGIVDTGLTGPAPDAAGPPSKEVLTCRHRALRAANGGACPMGCL